MLFCLPQYFLFSAWESLLWDARHVVPPVWPVRIRQLICISTWSPVMIIRVVWKKGWEEGWMSLNRQPCKIRQAWLHCILHQTWEADFQGVGDPGGGQSTVSPPLVSGPSALPFLQTVLVPQSDTWHFPWSLLPFWDGVETQILPGKKKSENLWILSDSLKIDTTAGWVDSQRMEGRNEFFIYSLGRELF